MSGHGEEGLGAPFEARLEEEGAAAPPRANGELVFDSPWQSRVFGITMSLCDEGRLEWSTFRERLIEEIGRFDRAHSEDGADYRYWEHWLAALTRSLEAGALLALPDLDARERELAARPAGHDHGHPHPHSHD